MVSITTVIVGIYIGTSVSAYVASIVDPGSKVTPITKVATKKSAPTVVTTPTPTPSTTVTPAPTPKVITVPAPKAVTPTPVVVPAPSSEVTSLAPDPTPPASQQNTTTSYTSTNWSGYMATTGTFTAVSGSWKATQPTGNGTSTSADATWIGIGGVSASDLIQVGTENAVSAAGVVSPAAFYELLPAGAQKILTITVTPGDSMHAAISYSAGQWTITITDVTNGQSYSTVVSYSSSFSSAEWIQEDPSYLSGQLIPLDNFGTAAFTSGSTTNAGTVMSIAAANADLITLVDSSGQTIATTSALGTDGASFSVTRN